MRLTDQPTKLEDYSESLDSKVKERYREKISPIGNDSLIIPDKNLERILSKNTFKEYFQNVYHR